MQQQRAARLLVVDDNADNRDVLGRRLQRLGYSDITYAADGVEAHELLAQTTFDGVLLDVMMPRMGGVELLELMKAEGRLVDTPVIMISAATETDIVVRCIELGAEDYLPKPFNPTLLRARLGSVLDKRALRAEVRAQLSRLERDLAQARAQQLAMVPSEFPGDGSRYTIHAAMHPAREVGGDLYDCFEITPDHLFLAVGDVSGKGMPAALFMARARSTLRATAMQIHELTGAIPRPADIVRLANKELCRNNESCMFITLFAGMLDLTTGEIGFVNAGHVRPIWLAADGTVSEIACPADLPLGIMDDVPHRTTSVRLQAGDALVVITDGLPEMMDPTEAFYTQQRVMSDLQDVAAAEPAALIAEICDRVIKFAAEAERADDVTALAIRLR